MARKFHVIYQLTAQDGDAVTLDTFRQALDGTGASLDKEYGVVNVSRKGTWVARGEATEAQLAKVKERGVQIFDDAQIAPA